MNATELKTYNIIKELYDCISAYGPDYMHGEPKKYYLKIAREEMDRLKSL